MKTRGLSHVVAITLLVMLSIFAVTILFVFILPMVQDNVREVSQERVQLSIETEGGFTLWDSVNKRASIQIKRGDDRQKLEAINFVFIKGRKVVKLNHTQSETNSDSLPEPGQRKIYVFDLFKNGAFEEKPSFVRISAVVAGEEQPDYVEMGSEGSGGLDFEEPSKKGHQWLNSISEGGNIGGLLPYEIDTCEDLQAMNDSLNGDFILMNNIDCTNTSIPGASIWGDGGFEPVGNCGEGSCQDGDEAPFTGTFDGGGFTIEGLYIYRPELNVTGLFGYLNDSEIYNVTINNLNYTGRVCVGGLAGYANLSNVSGVKPIGGLYSSEPGYLRLGFIQIKCTAETFGCEGVVDIQPQPPEGRIFNAPEQGCLISDLDPAI